MARILSRAESFLWFAEEAEVAGDLCGGGDDICFSGGSTFCALGVDRNIGAAEDEAGVESEIGLRAELFTESIEDTSCLVDGAVAGIRGEDW